MSSPPRLPPGLLLLGHRGASRRAPENTLVAVQEALRLGADGVEVDVQRTSDGVLVLAHDDDWQRTAGRATSVAETPWTEVCRYDVGRWFDPAFAGTPPTRLGDVLQALPSRALLNLELKSPQRHPGLAADVLALLQSIPRRPRILLTSFDRDCIDALAGVDPTVELGYLGMEPQRTDGAVKTQVLAYAAILARRQCPREIHAAGGRVLAWTVDDPRLAFELAGLGVDGLISNDPSRLRPGRDRA